MSIQVLYIAGAGRSGSTLLEVILGNRPTFFSVGEVRYFWEYWLQGDWLCGCGELLTVCPFWSGVHSRLQLAGVDVTEVAALASRYDRTRNLVGIACQRNHYFPPKLITATHQLYQAIRIESGAEIIVDSSKVPSHFYLLAQQHGIDLRLLHLIRDSRAVAYSWSQHQKRELGKAESTANMPHKTPVKATLVWFIENLFAVYGGRQSPYYTVLRYEDFVQHPDVALNKALQNIALPEQNLSYLKHDNFPVQPTHSVGGNPVRFRQHGITIHADETWRQSMSSILQIGLGIISWPLLAKFAYRI